MDIPQEVFAYLASLNVVQEGHVAKRKKASVVLTSEATRAILSGHVCFYIAGAFFGRRQIPVTQSLLGTPGETAAADAAHYNWSVVCEMLQKLGVSLSPDHRMLLGNGDPGIMIDLLKTLSKKLPATEADDKKHVSNGGAPAKARSPSPRKRDRDHNPTNRTGAVSVDQGKDRRRRKRSTSSASADSSRFDVFKDLERVRKKREEKLKKLLEAEEKQKETEHRMKEAREKFSEGRKGLLGDLDVSSAPLPCYLQFSNRGLVYQCHQIVLELVQQVMTGEAQEFLRMRELEHRKAVEFEKKRRAGDDRIVPHSSIPVARDANHRLVLMCKAIVLEMVTRSTLPETKEALHKREMEREAAIRNAEGIRKRIDHLYDLRTVRKKFDDIRKEEEAQEQEARELREKRYREMRQENAELAAQEAQEQRRLRQEKELAARLKEEEQRRREAERTLYYAEQKAKVLEARRSKAIEDELRKAKESEEERERREQRRQKAAEIAKKLLEKDLQRESAATSQVGLVPGSLNPISCGTGQRSGYTGSSLGWQFLTDDERHVAELASNLRSDPNEGLSIVKSRMENTKGGAVWFLDERGRRHPLTLSEGPQVHTDALEALAARAKRCTASATVHLSIALTLAARCHAADLAFHGKADPSTWHIGSDGSSATQRIARFGSGLGGPGTTAEVVISVVRPHELRLSANDILGFALVDDGCPTRENREALLKSVAAAAGGDVECWGVGHALATCGDDTVVEVFVILTAAGSYTDKPVPQLAAAQFHTLSSVAEPFLHDNRVVSRSIATSKKDLYHVHQVTIGRRTEGPTPFHLERLTHDPRSKAAAAAAAAAAEPPQPISEAKPAQRRKKKKPAAPAPADLYDGREVEPLGNTEEHSGGGGGALRRRLSSFFEKYAPEKVAVVDAALQMNQGREDVMFQRLTERYGPEPTSSAPASPTAVEQPGQSSPGVVPALGSKRDMREMRVEEVVTASRERDTSSSSKKQSGTDNGGATITSSSGMAVEAALETSAQSGEAPLSQHGDNSDADDNNPSRASSARSSPTASSQPAA